MPSVASGNHAVVGGDHVGAGDVARLVVGAAYVQRELHGAVGAKLLAVAVLGVRGEVARRSRINGAPYGYPDTLIVSAVPCKTYYYLDALLIITSINKV